MKNYYTELKKRLEMNPIMDGKDPVTSILEYFYWQYAQDNLPSSREVGSRFQKVDQILEKLSLEERNALFYTVCDICIEKEKQPFFFGIRVGGQRMLEMQIGD